MEFLARIKVGARVGIDSGVYKWRDDQMLFTAKIIHGDRFDLCAKGYGEKGAYGNGSVYVWSLNDLIIDAKTRECILDAIRDHKQAQINEAAKALASLQAEMAGIV